MDKDNVYPDKAFMKVAGEHDRNQLEVLVDEKDAKYVFDRGYIDYEWFENQIYYSINHLLLACAHPT